MTTQPLEKLTPKCRPMPRQSPRPDRLALEAEGSGESMTKKNGDGSKKKSSVKSSVLVPQKHGGALLPGAGGGPQPGSGRPPSKIREAARLAFSERLHVLTGIADDEDARAADRIGAMKVLSDTGGVDKIRLTVEEQPERQMTRERIAEMWERLQRIRSIEECERLLVGVPEEQAAAKGD